MANGNVELIRIALSRSADGGGFSFTAVMNAPDGSDFTVPLRDEDVLSYRAFQRTVLNKVGWLYRMNLCEGRPDEAADEAWRNAIVYVMDQPRPAVPATSVN